MTSDSGKTALWVCSAILGMLRAKGMVHDAEITSLAGDLEKAAQSGDTLQAIDVLRAAEWLRQSAGSAND